MEQAKLFCSLDIETTGFDPLTEEILEVGFCFFEVGKKGIKITEEWTQVFKPSKEVSPKILGLTGITIKELEKAPVFGEYKDFLQKKLQNAVIVGHNIVFDIRFLESKGIKFSGGKIDTLDLVQWLLPAHHSYNLENLMHYFKVPHEEAHRALADAKAALQVLENLFQIFASFTTELKKGIFEQITPHGFLWEEWFRAANFKNALPQPKQKRLMAKKTKSNEKKVFEHGTIYNFPCFFDYYPEVVDMASHSGEKVLLVFPKASQVLEWWKMGQVEPLFQAGELFDEKKFKKFLAKKNKTDDEVRFAIKVLVWQKTNWQNICLLDLNLTFFGGQFKDGVAKKKAEFNKNAKILACDIATFLGLAGKPDLGLRQVVVASLSEFEQAVSQGVGRRVSWGHISYLLKTVYNPETKIGNAKNKALVVSMLESTDLFFGLALALLKTQTAGFEYYKMTAFSRQTENFMRLEKAAQNYGEKLLGAAKVLKLEALTKAAKDLGDFFGHQENSVKWLELAETRCVFFNSPLSLEAYVNELLKKQKNLVFADSLPEGQVLDLIISRLGLKHFIRLNAGSPKEKKGLQQDLFAFNKILFRPKVDVYFQPSALDNAEILKKCAKKSYPMAILFPNPLGVKEFHEMHFFELQKTVNLLTQNQSGGSNKILRNFGIYKDSLLLATDKFILKYLENSSGSVESIKVKSLIIGKLPFEQYTHPYLEAVAAAYEKPFEQYSLPKAVLNLYKILKFFHSSDLKEIQIFDPKLAKSYAKSFIEIFLNNNIYNIH